MCVGESRQERDCHALEDDGILCQWPGILKVVDAPTCSTGTSATPARRLRWSARGSEQTAAPHTTSLQTRTPALTLWW